MYVGIAYVRGGKMKKKVLLVALAAAVVLTACGEKKESKNTVVDTAVEETEDEAESDGFKKGTISENGWESEFLGLRYTVPEGMIMTTEEELNSMMGISQEILSEDFSELQLQYAEMKSVYEMMSTDETGITNVVITIEKLPTSNMEAKQYIKAVEKALSQVSTINYVVESDDEVADIAGNEWTIIKCTADYNGTSMHQKQYIRVVDDRAAAITVTYIDDTEDMAEEIMNAFEPY